MIDLKSVLFFFIFKIDWKFYATETMSFIEIKVLNSQLLVFKIRAYLFDKNNTIIRLTDIHKQLRKHFDLF